MNKLDKRQPMYNMHNVGQKIENWDMNTMGHKTENVGYEYYGT